MEEFRWKSAAIPSMGVRSALSERCLCASDCLFSLSLWLCVLSAASQLLCCLLSLSLSLSLCLSLSQFFSTTVTAALCCYPILQNSSCLGVLQHCLQTKAFFFSFSFKPCLKFLHNPIFIFLPSFLVFLLFLTTPSELSFLAFFSHYVKTFYFLWSLDICRKWCHRFLSLSLSLTVSLSGFFCSVSEAIHVCWWWALF